MTLQLEIDDNLTQQLTYEAVKQGTSIEELLVTLAKKQLDREQLFSEASNYVLTKNAELYRRLAK